MDEGHKAKNVDTRIRQAIRDFKVRKMKVVLTGTPVQNNLMELYSLLDIVQPGVLGMVSSFRSKFQNTI